MVWFLTLQLVKGILVNIHTKFGLFTCLVCPTIEINMCTVALKKSLINPHEHPHTFQYHDHSRSTNGSDEKKRKSSVNLDSNIGLFSSLPFIEQE